MNEEEERVAGAVRKRVNEDTLRSARFSGHGPQPEGCETDGDAVDLCRLESIMP